MANKTRKKKNDKKDNVVMQTNCHSPNSILWFNEKPIRKVVSSLVSHSHA